MLNAKIVGQVICELRTKKGLSQEATSGLAGISRTHLSMIEKGRRKPNLDTIFKISEALNVSPSEIVKIIEEKNKLYTKNL